MMKGGGHLLSRIALQYIGAGGLNFSVRNGKRWDTAAITTWNVSLIAVRTPCIPHAKGRKTTGGNRKGLTPAKTSTAGKKHEGKNMERIIDHNATYPAERRKVRARKRKFRAISNARL